jgi:hypothetical protein
LGSVTPGFQVAANDPAAQLLDDMRKQAVLAAPRARPETANRDHSYQRVTERTSIDKLDELTTL